MSSIVDVTLPISTAGLVGLGVAAVTVRAGAKAIRAAIVVTVASIGYQIYESPETLGAWVDKSQEMATTVLTKVFPSQEEEEIERLVQDGRDTAESWFSEENRDRLYEQITDGSERLGGLSELVKSDKGPENWGIFDSEEPGAASETEN